MLKNLATIFRYFFFWLLFFFLERLIFLLWFADKLKGVSIGQVFKSFFVGLWMDTSMAGYISVLPLIVVSVGWLIPTIPIPSKALRWYTTFLVVVFSIIAVFNFNIYREWGSKINYKALDMAFSSPNEALASSASSPIFLSVVILAGLIFTSIWLSRKVIAYHRLKEVNIFLKIFVVAFLLGLNFLAIRGGWQLSPMNESMAYYSATPVLNHAAVNTEWALLKDVLSNKSTKNPYRYIPKNEAEGVINEIYAEPKSSTTPVLTTQRPNVVVVIMESFTADVVESLGGDKGVAPQTEKLADEGILFSNIYASGDRTDKGTVAVLNAFPSQAIKSIMKSNAKQEKLPSLSQNFAAYGYSTNFLYGGESEFFNMKSYLLSHKYQRIVDKNNFKHSEMNSKWGAYDDVVYNRALEESSKLKQPFFSTILTLTNHEPFEVPGNARFGGSEVENKFRSTAYYADSCLGAFIENARKQAWGKNTLFVVVADHGHRLPRNQSEIYHPNRFRIPLLFVGDVIRPEFRGKRIEKIAGQTDIAKTLFTQLNMKSEHFKWSRDIMNPATADFAFFDWDNGFGVVGPDQTISFDNTGKSVVFKKVPKSGHDDELLHKGKAMMQQIFAEYLSY